MAVRTLLFVALVVPYTFTIATECEPTCPDGEELDKCPCDSPADYCPKSEQDNQTCESPDSCPPAECKCVFNKRRADNGTCIDTVDCPPFDCPGCNEEYVACPPICPSDDCGKPRLTGICPYRIGIRLECTPKCQCKADYARFNGNCIPIGKCPNICDEGEEYSSCTEAVCRAQNCSNRDSPVACPAMAECSCTRGCVCQENKFRNKVGKCVPRDECEDQC